MTADRETSHNTGDWLTDGPDEQDLRWQVHPDPLRYVDQPPPIRERS